jgi:hypothetical protein
MVALYVARCRLASWNEFPVETLSIFVNFINNSTAMIELSSLGATCGRTGGCQANYSCKLMI